MAQPTLIAAICVLTLSHVVQATTFTIVNKCDYVVWPGILSNAGVPTLATTGFTLQRGETKTITAPTSWGGRFWGRTHCSQDSDGKFSCLTGDCGSGKLECSGNGAAPPATLAEFTLDGAGGLDFFDVSLVDGYNIPMLVVPQGGKAVTAGDGIACKSACEAFRQPQYCCSGAYATPDTCKPSSYSQVFKTACPRAYSYAYDDKTSTFTCANAADYSITFCPSPNTSQKSSQEATTPGQNTETTTTAMPTSPLVDNTIMYEGLILDESEASPFRVTTYIFGIITVAIWWWCQIF
ncbi:hypothetical protein GOBAR_DD02091 [Gossypium barbadense]|nr:hypothetical protein GOBAR_DD02091 [Gossypium barbadense]